MLEGKTANNIVDRYHRIITGDQNQIEVNSNKVVTVTGTMADPWGDLDVAELQAGINDNSLTIWMTASLGGQTTVPICPRKANDGAMIFSSVIIRNGSIFDGLSAEYATQDGHAIKIYGIGEGGELTDYMAFANQITTELTVIYHPLPEE